MTAGGDPGRGGRGPCRSSTDDNRPGPPTGPARSSFERGHPGSAVDRPQTASKDTTTAAAAWLADTPTTPALTRSPTANDATRRCAVAGATHESRCSGSHHRAGLDPLNELEPAQQSELAPTVLPVRSSSVGLSSQTAPSAADRTSPSQPFTKSVGTSASAATRPGTALGRISTRMRSELARSGDPPQLFASLCSWRL